MSVDSATTSDLLRKDSFAFVQSLAHELSAGQVDLPSFPEVALKVRKALDDEKVTVARVAKIAGSEAGLASRILVLANSAAMGYGNSPVTDLTAAVTRVGLSNVRSAALVFALGQLRRATQFKHIMKDLERLWHDSTQVAALSRVLAVRTGTVNPDLAMLAGLLHNIGAVYILARASVDAGLVRQTEIREMLLRDWSESIGRSIAENWGLPEVVVEAIGRQSDLEGVRRGSPDVADILAVAVAALKLKVAEAAGTPDLAPIALSRLGLSSTGWAEVMADSDTEIAELRTALSG